MGQPLVNHETGNIGSFPDVEAQIPRWENGPMKPWWLTPVRESLATRGLLRSNMSDDSGALWAVTVCIKFDELCIKYDGLCIKHDGFCIKHDGY